MCDLKTTREVGLLTDFPEKKKSQLFGNITVFSIEMVCLYNCRKSSFLILRGEREQNISFLISTQSQQLRLRCLTFFCYSSDRDIYQCFSLFHLLILSFSVSYVDYTTLETVLYMDTGKIYT